MRHLKGIALKLIATIPLLYVILGVLYDMSFRNVLLISLVLGIVSYIIGDLFILPKTNNLIATAADFGLALLVIWFMSENLAYGDNIFTMSLIAALGVTLFELLFHMYMANNVLNGDRSNQKEKVRLQYQTEASDELTPKRDEFQKRNRE